jgi:site-specific DNA-methyltransferase (adenine-specific)
MKHRSRNDSSAARLQWPNRTPDPNAPKAELELVRSGHPGSMLVCGDNLAAMSALLDRGGPSFALVYMDPPFFTGRDHAIVTRRRDPRSGRIERSHAPGFGDRWPTLEDYLTELARRLTLARRLLLDHGCLVLHVDPKTSHYAKILCDEIFGRDCFASEIIWRYRRWPAKTRNFQRVHDVLLRYVRDASATPRFHQLYEPLAPSTLATWGTRKQRAVVDDDGRRLRSSQTKATTEGAPLGDVWEIGIVAPVARERTGYPTQKPEALLERLITACTDPDDLVLDPYVGSGTTLVTAARLGRPAVGIDANKRALKIARGRLKALGVKPLEERAVELDSASSESEPADARNVA